MDIISTLSAFTLITGDGGARTKERHKKKVMEFKQMKENRSKKVERRKKWKRRDEGS